MKKDENQSSSQQQNGKLISTLTKEQEIKLINDVQNYYEKEQAMQQKQNRRKQKGKYTMRLCIVLFFLVGIFGAILVISSIFLIKLQDDIPSCRFTRMNLDRNFEPLCALCIPGYVLVDPLTCIQF